MTLQAVIVELSPEMKTACEAARRAEAALCAELYQLLTPEAIERILEGDHEFIRRVVLGRGAT